MVKATVVGESPKHLATSEDPSTMETYDKLKQTPLEDCVDFSKMNLPDRVNVGLYKKSTRDVMKAELAEMRQLGKLRTEVDFSNSVVGKFAPELGLVSKMEGVLDNLKNVAKFMNRGDVASAQIVLGQLESEIPFFRGNQVLYLEASKAMQAGNALLGDNERKDAYAQRVQSATEAIVNDPSLSGDNYYKPRKKIGYSEY